MARTPIPPSATAVRKRIASERRSRCAMLTFSCFFPLETGTAGLVLTARIAQRYIIIARSATPTGRTRHVATTCCSDARAALLVVGAEHGGYTVAPCGASCTLV